MNKKTKIIFTLFMILSISFAGNIYADSNKKSQITKDTISAFNLMKNLISENNKSIINVMPNTFHMNFIYGTSSPSVSFPYNYNMGTNVFLPKEGININNFTQNIGKYNFDRWINDFENTYVLQQIPKFKMYYNINSNNPLKCSAFDPERTNFTVLITSDVLSQVSLYINRIKYKTYIIIEGTEAAIFTTEVIHRTSTSHYNKPIYFNVNRPFFIIRDNKTEVISFKEKIYDPNTSTDSPN